MVSRSECHGITVGREHPPPRERTCTVLGFALQPLSNLLWDYAAAEDPGESVADHTL